jgi:hypothetical protein
MSHEVIYDEDESDRKKLIGIGYKISNRIVSGLND